MWGTRSELECRLHYSPGLWLKSRWPWLGIARLRLIYGSVIWSCLQYRQIWLSHQLCLQDQLSMQRFARKLYQKSPLCAQDSQVAIACSFYLFVKVKLRTKSWIGLIWLPFHLYPVFWSECRWLWRFQRLYSWPCHSISALCSTFTKLHTRVNAFKV